MFDQISSAKKRQLPRYTAVSIGVHGVLVALFLLAATLRSKEPEKKEVEVSFIGPGKGKGQPPPPPPPPAAKKHTVTPRRKPILAKVEIPRPLLEPPKVVEPPPRDEPEEEDDDEGEVSGVEGGVVGGVQGGVVGGQVGGTGGGGTLAPTPPERPKAKNVPPFVIARDMIRQAPPRMSEMFKAGHRGQQVTGMYRVCVDTDGKVYEVIPVKVIDGANEEIIDGIKADWLYKPQQVPVCFLYNMVVTVQQ
jgi:protein TonB